MQLTEYGQKLYLGTILADHPPGALDRLAFPFSFDREMKTYRFHVLWHRAERTFIVLEPGWYYSPRENKPEILRNVERRTAIKIRNLIRCFQHSNLSNSSFLLCWNSWPRFWHEPYLAELRLQCYPTMMNPLYHSILVSDDEPETTRHIVSASLMLSRPWDCRTGIVTERLFGKCFNMRFSLFFCSSLLLFWSSILRSHTLLGIYSNCLRPCSLWNDRLRFLSTQPFFDDMLKREFKSIHSSCTD
jgi:hypothetical protein